MLLNEHIALHTDKVVLVPYSSHHVPKYHEWMQDPEIQASTASEPLTIEEEYDMQRSWRQDADKLTFISGIPITSLQNVDFLKGQEQYTMIGDVNLFITTDFDDATGADALVGELELMVAEKAQQGKGLGRATLIAFLQFVVDFEGALVDEYSRSHKAGPWRKLEYLRVKIRKDNSRSLKLFAGLRFEQVGEVSYFGEVELRQKLDRSAVDELRKRYGLDEARQVRYEDTQQEQDQELV